MNVTVDMSKHTPGWLRGARWSTSTSTPSACASQLRSSEAGHAPDDAVDRFPRRRKAARRPDMDLPKWSRLANLRMMDDGSVSDSIDPDLDFASYYQTGRDPDRDCERLYQWHRALWGRSVPGAAPFELEIIHDRGYGLRLRSAKNPEIRLASDSIIPTWSTPSWTNRFAPDLVAEIAKDANDFYRIACTIGGYIVLPRNRTGQTGQTINQARGTHPAIADRFDLTLECIRRHYSEPAAENPLGSRLAAYGDFFVLFNDFDTYVRFFLLDDLITEDRDAVRSLISGEPLREFRVPAFAETAAEYADYRHRTIKFVTARNARIRQLGL
jgi:hypothetical protein